MDLITLAAAKTYTEQSLMGAGAVKGADGKDGVDGKDGLSIKAISITQDSTGKIIDATATLSDDTTLKVDITTVGSDESDNNDGGGSDTGKPEEDGFDSVEF